MKFFRISLILLLLYFLGTGIVSAQNYFQPGTTWFYSVVPWWPDVYSDDTIQLIEAVNQDGEKCFQEKIHNISPTVVGTPPNEQFVPVEKDYMGDYVKVDGAKIYACSPQSEKAEWRLVYDFSLEQGQGCSIPARIHKIHLDLEGYPIEDYDCDCFFKYEEDAYLEQYATEFMKINVYESEAESADEANAIWTEYWLKGLGGRDFFISPREYHIPRDGGWDGFSYPKLQCATAANGDVIVKDSDWTGIEEVSADRVETEAVYYDLSGRRIERPANGIFIEKKGNQARKVAL